MSNDSKFGAWCKKVGASIKSATGLGAKGDEKFVMTKKERNWALYDAGNSAIYMFFILIGVSIGELAHGTYFADNPTQTMSIFNAATGLIVALMGPVLGAIADNKGRKKPMFRFFVYMGIAGCAFSLFSNIGGFMNSDWGFFVPFAISMVLILVGLGGSILFYDSMLPDVTTEARSDQVSARGYAYGYIFSCIPFVICLAIYYFFMDPVWAEENVAFVGAGEGYKYLRLAITICLVISGTWWYFFTRPLLKTYDQLSGVDPVKHQIRDAFKKLGKTFKELQKYKAAFLFMLAFFFYINGVNTVIALSATYATVIYGSDLAAYGLSSSSILSVLLVVALLMTQVIACVCSIIFGNISKKYGAKNLIIASVIGYFVFTVYGVFMGKIAGLGDFFILAAGIGIFQGGIQALSRSYFSKLAPVEKQSEFFGLYDIFNKSSNFLGSALFTAISLAATSIITNGTNDATVAQIVLVNRIAVACLTVFFIVGLVIMFCLPKNHADVVKDE